MPRPLLVVLLLAILPACMAAKQPHPVRAAIVDKINSNPDSTWTAMAPSENPFSTWSRDDIMGLFGLPNLQARVVALRGSTNAGRSVGDDKLPTSWDSRDKFSSCMTPIRNQQNCGSCWAFGAAETLSDNLCIMGQDAGVLSPQDLVSCDMKNKGCNGGDLIDAWAYLADTGIVTDSCMPYTAFNGTRGACDEHGCPKFKCTAGHNDIGSETYNFLNSANDIKWAVMHFGSAETGFYVYEDFMSYKSGVYKHDNTTSNLPLGGHAVKIIGWGTDPVAGEYYLVANSWGTAWGMSGYFKIALSDKDSAFALGGAFNCGNLPPTPQPGPAPGPSPTCADILPSDKCAQFKDNCAKAVWMECKQTCGCCKEFGKPSYCN